MRHIYHQQQQQKEDTERIECNKKFDRKCSQKIKENKSMKLDNDALLVVVSVNIKI